MSRCEGRGAPTRQTPGRDRRGRGPASEAVLGRAGSRCAFTKGGIRCERVGPEVEAHHIVPLRMGGSSDPVGNGVALCRRRHRIVEQETTAAAAADQDVAAMLLLFGG